MTFRANHMTAAKNGLLDHQLAGTSTINVHCIPKKESQLMFDINFGKCGPIFKILSPTDS